VSGVGRRGFCGVCVSGGGAGAVSPATYSEPTEEWFEKEGEEERGEGVALEGSSVNVDGGSGAVWGDIRCGGDPVELFTNVHKGGGHVSSCRMSLNMMRWSAAFKSSLNSPYMT
jgi:hypothetical protein